MRTTIPAPPGTRLLKAGDVKVGDEVVFRNGYRYTVKRVSKHRRLIRYHFGVNEAGTATHHPEKWLYVRREQP